MTALSGAIVILGAVFSAFVLFLALSRAGARHTTEVSVVEARGWTAF